MIEAPYYNVVERLAQELERFRREKQRLERLIALDQVKILLPEVETLLQNSTVADQNMVRALVEEAHRAVEEGEQEKRQHIRTRPADSTSLRKAPLVEPPPRPRPVAALPPARENVFVYLAPDRASARTAGRLLDEAFPPDILTGLNFFVRSDGRTFIVVLLAGSVDWDVMTRARLLLGRYATRQDISLRALLAEMERGTFVEQHLGEQAIQFLYSEHPTR